MLINNLREHREKYSYKFFTSPSRSIKSSSNSKIASHQAKTQNQFHLKSKLGSQKKFKTQRLSNFQSNPTHKIVTEEGFYKQIMSKKMRHQDNQWIDKKVDYVKPCEKLKQSQKHKEIQSGSQKFNARQKIQRKPTKRKIMIPFCEQSGSEDKLSTKQQTGSRFQPTTKPNTKTQITSYPSQQSIRSNYKSIILENERTREDMEKQEKIIGGLRVNQVFFCRDCYRYIFAIEKNYHYPKCKHPFPTDLSAEDRYRAGLEKISLLVELAEYTKYKAGVIKNLYNQIKKGHKIPPRDGDQITGRRYYTLIQIQTAAYIIVNSLISDYSLHKNSNFCNNVLCDVNSQL